MRTIDQWLGLYAENHRDPTNKRIHWVCVPLIVWTVVAMLYSAPAPLTGLWAWLAVLCSSAYYLVLSPRLGAGLIVVAAGLCMLSAQIHSLVGSVALAITAAVVFVLAWIAQFIGHEIEGKKPSFLNDLAFLLIGPAWLMAYVYRRTGLRY